MSQKTNVFLKGGLGCLGVFFVIAFLTVVAGGRAHIDIGGALCLFIGGGLFSLLVLAIYNHGMRDGRK